MMKKLIALLLAAVMMLCSVSFAEETAETIEAQPVTEEIDLPDVEDDEILNFNITMDKLPEGYVINTYPVDGAVYATFVNENSPVVYFVSVAHSEEFFGYTLNVAELTEEQKANVAEVFSLDFYNPDISFVKTAHGTDVIMIDENNYSYDCVEYVTVYDGYIITLDALRNEGKLSEEELATALQLLSDMWVVPAN